MRDYIRKSNGIPPSLHYRVKAILLDYDRMRRLRQDIIYGGGCPADGMPKNAGAGAPTENRAVRLATISRELEAVGQVCSALRGAYSGKTREGFDPIKAYWQYDYFNYEHIRTRQSPNGPSRRTWYRYKDQFTLLLANKLNLF